MMRKAYILLLGLLISGAALSQNYTLKAFKAYQDSSYGVAKTYIDSAIADPDESQSSQTWRIRGYIYKAIYKYVDEESRNSKARPEAIDAYVKSIELDEEKKFYDNNAQSVKFLATTYYNDAVVTLKPETYNESLDMYEKYKETLKIINPNYDFTAQDVQFYNALGGVYHKLYNRDKESDNGYFEKAIETYKKTLEFDKDNNSANYNIGILYYNKGVDLILALDAEASLQELVDTQEKCVELFKKALPYMNTAHEQRPKNIEIMNGLKGIWFNLNNKEKVDYYDQKIKELKEGSGR